jgi:thiol-disulfide isomerase/thioredoxin
MKRIIRLAFILMMATIANGQSVQKAPALALKDLSGRTIRLSDYKGKLLIVNFWATWCPPCRAEMPDMVKMQRNYGKSGLQVIGITYPPQTVREVQQFVRKLKINYPVVLGTKETKSLFDRSETLPLTIIIDRDGNIRDRIEGILLSEEFEQKIKPLLK